MRLVGFGLVWWWWLHLHCLCSSKPIEKSYFPGHNIVYAARAQVGVPYVWRGGDYLGKSKSYDPVHHVFSQKEGFDCGSLAQYAVYKGTGKIIGRTPYEQYNDDQCTKVMFQDRLPGDLLFVGPPLLHLVGHVQHVAVVSFGEHFIHAPGNGRVVREISFLKISKRPFFFHPHVVRCY